ncbi:hypothetical protein HED50_01800 [Ochrobactrum oryzae]|nr:hypothetical protein [Brucella oryzae]
MAIAPIAHMIQSAGTSRLCSNPIPEPATWSSLNTSSSAVASLPIKLLPVSANAGPLPLTQTITASET